MTYKNKDLTRKRIDGDSDWKNHSCSFIYCVESQNTITRVAFHDINEEYNGH